MTDTPEVILARTISSMDGVLIAKRQITALRAAGYAIIRDWQPMEAAPKGNGDIVEMAADPNWIEPPQILLRFGDEAVSVAYWDWYYAEGGLVFTDGFAWIEPCSGEPLNLHYTTPPTGWKFLLESLTAAEG